jgi:hypoxanthine phosphoribosyltransferase
VAKSSVSSRVDSALLPSTTPYAHNYTSISKRTQSVVPRQREARAIRFAHPAEAEIARLLDFYGVQWQYEPKTFSLVTNEHGLPLQSFTPDFYLPEQDLYIEMTTMRQSLVTRKNRKFRLLRELYPDLNVKLLYRKDVEHILERYSRSLEVDAGDLPIRQVIREEQVLRRATEMAESLIEQSSDSCLLLALGSSAARTQHLMEKGLAANGCAVTLGELCVDHFAQGGLTCSVRLSEDLDLDPATNVVVVADIIGTGLTALAAIRWLRRRGVDRVRLISLLDKRSSRLVDVPLDLAGFSVTSNWHVGAGLGQAPRYRDLPDIHVITVPPAA